MRGIIAKQIRRVIYGSGHHPGLVVYHWDEYVFGTPKRIMRRILADQDRKLYQWAKRNYNNQ